MPDIWAFMRAVRNSDLPHPVRLVLLTLASLANPESAVIPERFTPSLTELARMTGLGRSTVAEALKRVDVEQSTDGTLGGWVKRVQPSIADARINKAKTQYALLVPGPCPGLVQDMDQPDQPNSDTVASAGDGLVQEPDGASPGAGHEVPTDTTKNSPTGSSTRPRRRRKGSTEQPTRIPDDFGLTDEMIAWGRKHAPLVNGAKETEIFIRYWRTKTRDFKKTNWVMTWETWILREQKRLQEQHDRDQQRAAERMAGTNGSAYPRRRDANGSRRIPEDERCARHPTYRAASCGPCRSERHGTTAAEPRTV